MLVLLGEPDVVGGLLDDREEALAQLRFGALARPPRVVISAGAAVGQPNRPTGFQPAGRVDEPGPIRLTIQGQFQSVDPLGLVQDVWILTDAERAKQPWPTKAADAKAWSFDPIAQVWTKP